MQRSWRTAAAAAAAAAAARIELLSWLEVRAAERGPGWLGRGEWSYVECQAKAAEMHK